MRNLKQVLIWLKRFRYRCGYGVHSPFAFDFITNVIYEKTRYYAYSEIETGASTHARKVNRLLFRLVNRVQPHTIISTGQSQLTSAYLQAGKRTATFFPLSPKDESAILSVPQVDFLHVDCSGDPAFVERVTEYGITHTDTRSMIVLQGIYQSPSAKALWKRVVADERVGITFDLYDLGILFFDKSKIKQHYIVNF